MTLFPSTATLKVLLTWAGNSRKQFAVKISDELRKSAPDGFAVSMIPMSHDDPRYNELSQQAIEEADCVLMVAGESDFRDRDSAVREWEFFCELVRRSRKTRNQFRFVRVQGEDCPLFANAGLRPLKFRNPSEPTHEEVQTAFDYFAAVIAQKPLLSINLSKSTLLEPGGEIAATLWAATLDESVFEAAASLPDATPTVQFLEALRRLKALHSIHGGLGAMLKGPMEALQQHLSAGLFDVEKIRKLMVNGLSPFQHILPSPLEDELHDCIAHGLMPTMRMLAQRLAAMPAYKRELLFVEAAMERLAEILDASSTANTDFELYDGRWWVDRYQRLLALVQKRFGGIITDTEGADLLSPGEASTISERRFGQTLNVSQNLLASTIQLTFLVLVVFSFLHTHQRVKDANLIPDYVEDTLEQLAQDWRYGHPTDAVVKWSNQMILCLLAVVSVEGGMKNAAA